jgi:hypothetical protein
MSASEDRSFARLVSPNGIFIGTSYSPEQVNRGFATFTQTADTHYMPAGAGAEFVSTTGLVGGHACPDREGESPGCGGDLVPYAVHWQPMTGELSPHPGFLATWMNNDGRMLGYQELPDGSARASQRSAPQGMPSGTMRGSTGTRTATGSSLSRPDFIGRRRTDRRR